MPILTCAKGCGDSLFVSQEALNAAMAAGVLVFSHGVCPRDVGVEREYRIDITICRFGGETLAMTGASVSGSNISAAFPALVQKLQDNLVRMAGTIQFAEDGLDDPAVTTTNTEGSVT